MNFPKDLEIGVFYYYAMTLAMTLLRTHLGKNDK